MPPCITSLTPSNVIGSKDGQETSPHVVTIGSNNLCHHFDHQIGSIEHRLLTPPPTSSSCSSSSYGDYDSNSDHDSAHYSVDTLSVQRSPRMDDHVDHNHDSTIVHDAHHQRKVKKGLDCYTFIKDGDFDIVWPNCIVFGIAHLIHLYSVYFLVFVTQDIKNMQTWIFST